MGGKNVCAGGALRGVPRIILSGSLFLPRSGVILNEFQPNWCLVKHRNPLGDKCVGFVRVTRTVVVGQEEIRGAGQEDEVGWRHAVFVATMCTNTLDSR